MGKETLPTQNLFESGLIWELSNEWSVEQVCIMNGESMTFLKP